MGQFNISVNIRRFAIVSSLLGLGFIGLGCKEGSRGPQQQGILGGGIAGLDVSAASLATPSVSIKLLDGANTLQWDAIEGAVSYDLYFSPTEIVDLNNTSSIKGVVSPYTHIKPDQTNYNYLIVAKGASDDVFSAPSESISDLPEGYLLECLSYADAQLVTRDAMIEASASSSCYDFVDRIEETTTLDLNAQQLTDLSPLTVLKNLEFLTISQNNVTDLTPLASLNNLKSLNISDNPELTNIESLASLVLLEEIDFSNTQISDLTALKDMSLLKILFMENTAVSNLTQVSLLPALESASFVGNEVERVEAMCPTVSVQEDLARFCLEGVAVTYVEQVSKLFQLHCTGCHNVDNDDLSNLDNEVDATNISAQVNARVSDGSMPPNGPLSLTDQAIIARWYAATILAETD